jgi:indole-3-glycerol phosphate synthase
MSRLEAILESKRREIEALRARPARGPAALASRAPLDVFAALRRGQRDALRLIAEVKLKSPSAGPLSRALDCPSRALAYAAGGVAMVSVLCDGPFFDGSFEELAAARAALDAAGLAVPLLAKEFVLHDVQIAAAREHGADAVLLIARIVSRPLLRELADAARGRGLEPFVEVVDEAELDAAVYAGARVVGVNARDLDTLAMDAERAARVLARIPGDAVAVHLSGVKDEAGVRTIAAGRADAALVGEALMREDDPRPLLARLTAAGKFSTPGSRR